MSELLAVRSLAVEFKVRGSRSLRRATFTAVRDVSFTVQEHESVGIVGESGSGKTTVARVVAGLLKPARGAVTLSPPTDERGRRGIGMVFQDPLSSLNPRLTIGSTLTESIRVAEPGTSRSDSAQRLRELLEVVGLPASVVNRYPGDMSGGQRQRVAIARALASRPRLLVCDEPTSALDVSVQAQILRKLRELQRDLGLATLVISHDLGVVAYACDRVLVMHRGEIVEQGATATILAQPSNPYSQLLIDSHPALPDYTAEPGLTTLPGQP